MSPLLLLLHGAAVFALAAWLPSLLAAAGFWPTREVSLAVSQVAGKTALLLFSLVAIRVSRRPGSDFGLRASPPGVRWLRVVLLGGLLGGAATALILGSPARGIPGLVDLGFVRLVLLIWLLSSVAEEVFVRGWLQSSIGFETETSSIPVVASGLFFGAMHLSLIARGADPVTVAVIVSATTALGLQTAWLRQRHGSLVPPIVAHLSFNVGGFVVGGLFQIVSIARTGAPIPS